MKAHEPSALILVAKAVLHHPIPDFSRGAILGNLFEKVIMSVEEKAQARAEVVHIEPATARPLHILDAVIECECQLLQSSRASLANVISADGNRVEAGSELCAEFEGVNDQRHRWRERIDVFLLCD